MYCQYCGGELNTGLRCTKCGVADGTGAPNYTGEPTKLETDLRAERDSLKARVERLEGALGDLIRLSRAAMNEANNDMGEYDIEAELSEARAALAEGEKKP